MTKNDRDEPGVFTGQRRDNRNNFELVLLQQKFCLGQRIYKKNTFQNYPKVFLLSM